MEISPISYLFNTLNIFIAIMDAVIDIHIYMYCIVATKLWQQKSLVDLVVDDQSIKVLSQLICCAKQPVSQCFCATILLGSNLPKFCTIQYTHTHTHTHNFFIRIGPQKEQHRGHSLFKGAQRMYTDIMQQELQVHFVI